MLGINITIMCLLVSSSISKARRNMCWNFCESLIALGQEFFWLLEHELDWYQFNWLMTAAW
uniref:Uncharacterized protein n=1 Tax=Rhizophora mucronata TaxID=61149 RepID=A0A2P2NFH2_RHIMU